MNWFRCTVILSLNYFQILLLEKKKVLQKYLKIILLHDPRPAPPCGALESVSSPRKPSARENFDLEEKFRFVSRWRPKFVPSEGE